MGKAEGQIAEQTGAWLKWLEVVPHEERAYVAEQLNECDVTTDEGMLLFLQRVYIEVVNARLPPTIVESSLMVLDRMITILFKMKETHGPQIVESVMQRTLTETFKRSKQVKGKFISADAVRPQLEAEPDVITVEEVAGE